MGSRDFLRFYDFVDRALNILLLLAGLFNMGLGKKFYSLFLLLLDIIIWKK